MMRACLKISFLLFSGAAFAVGLGGYYEVQTRFAEDGTWQLEKPSHRFEIRLNASPFENTEAFAKFYADISRLQDNDPERQLSEYTLLEGHLKYRSEHFEVITFTRENRFWFPQGLYELVNADRLTDDGNAQGVRADFWGIGPFSGTAYCSDWSNSDGADAAVARLYAPFFGDRIRFSAIAGRKNGGGSASDYNSIISGEIGCSVGRIVPFLWWIGNADFEGQVATSRIQDEPDDVAWAAEFRQLKIGSLELQGGYHDYGAQFRSSLSNQFDNEQKYNEEGFYGRAVYFFPEKAINFIAGYSEIRAPQNRMSKISETNIERTNREAYGEVYIEWVNDIKSKFRYKFYRGWDKNYGEYRNYPVLLGEVSVENRLAKVEGQLRIKDVGTDHQLVATGLELNANLTENLKLYARAVNVAERYESRQTAFVQLRYERFRPAEIFIEFGESGDSDNDLTNDDDFVSEAASQGVNKQIKLFVKVSF